MLKNRESASLSRKRKKEHVDTLEKKCADAIADRSALLLRIAALETENQRLRQQKELEGVRSSKPRAVATGVTCLLAFMTVFSLFSSPITPSLNDRSGLVLFGNSNTNIKQMNINVNNGVGRSLKSLPAVAENQLVPHIHSSTSNGDSGTHRISTCTNF